MCSPDVHALFFGWSTQTVILFFSMSSPSCSWTDNRRRKEIIQAGTRYIYHLINLCFIAEGVFHSSVNRLPTFFNRMQKNEYLCQSRGKTRKLDKHQVSHVHFWSSSLRGLKSIYISFVWVLGIRWLYSNYQFDVMQNTPGSSPAWKAGRCRHHLVRDWKSLRSC